MSWAEKASSTTTGLGLRVQGVLGRGPSPPESPSRPAFALRQQPTTASFLHRRTHELSKHVVSLSPRIRAILARASQMTAGPFDGKLTAPGASTATGPVLILALGRGLRAPAT
ncbi:hypothetical protein COCMIDRAFT_4623 [Bipolaris oryzae ATCC 44560]|uniref:Uncharacterized protein n=1 Tax=Bipolaris oryzae ATCC 44560 TaxID=930090 RepID=W6Z904_COCMI|nr:uncharacterized protein COCMIDRAFT_4623 [Bipolaris oryzae ATCC 44560]EUC46238.1 hypothetical protein COCMIDRAFT_4623 [Bipolaris oryzae ATCC 44560]